MSPSPTPNATNNDATVVSAPTVAAVFPLKAGTVIGGYELIEKLGEGGMGTVFLAEDMNLRRKVAIKVLKPMYAGEVALRVRFLREARAAARLEHDNIVPIYQVGEDQGILFLAMQYLHGESLRSRLKREPRPNLSFLLKVGRDVAQGLAAAHDAGFIHRDIKPDNIWIETPTNSDPTSSERAKILDFGLVRPQEGEEGLTHAGAVLGTPAYMSPEQACGETLDHRSDLFSLGCVLYQMGTGRLPFEGASAFSILSNLALNEPPDPRSLNPDLPSELSKLIIWMLDKDPDARPSSARDVISELRKLQPGHSVPAMPAIREAVAIPQVVSTPEPSPFLPVMPLPKPPELSDVPFVNRPSRMPLWIGVIGTVLLLLAGVGYMAFTVGKQPKETGSLTIEVNSDAMPRFQKGNLRIYDTNGNTLHTLSPSERARTLDAGVYRIKTLDIKGLKVEPGEFTIGKNNPVIVRVSLESEP